ncbi:hypothetical protein Tco_0727153 [Tanacetum coccineum]|uniref:Uncharacterized protein n=1 Tax=Tanacetum coccineum TaxID=301880 RepID=A0ABQ4YK16_9ASTR
MSCSMRNLFRASYNSLTLITADLSIYITSQPTREFPLFPFLPIPFHSLATPAPQDKWSRDKHIELVNIVGNPEAGMLIGQMAKEISDVSARECIFIDFLSKVEPKKVFEALKPDIQFSTCLYARYQANPKESHLIAIKRIFRYLKGTVVLVFGKALQKLLGGKLLFWSAKKQQYMAISSTEAKYVAAAGCCANILWMKCHLSDYDIVYEKV